MAKINFESLSPEEVAALNSKQKEAYDKWLAKKESGGELVTIKALKSINLSVHGRFAEGQSGKVTKAVAEQLEKLGECEIVQDED
jgi:hypothetical protein